MLLNIISVFLLQTVSGWLIDTRYKNYILYQVTAFNSPERSVLYNVHTKNDATFFLNGVSNEASTPMYVIVDECCTEEFEITMKNNDIEYINIHKHSVLEEFNERIYRPNDTDKTHGKEPILNEQFFDWGNIMAWVQNKVKRNKVLEKIHIGETYERRELFILKISNGIKKPAVFIMGGEQGRDWMSPAVILNFINNILIDETEELAALYDIYLMPVFNPDGYEYTMKEERFWNKNRKHFYPEKMCQNIADDEVAIGVNIDRNWYFTNSGYIQDSECDSVYLGHATLSEEETKALSRFLNTIAVDLMAFINLRGFAKILSTPYAEPNEEANNHATVIEMLLHAADKLFLKYNVSYNLCSTGKCFYNQTGNSPDWVKKYMNVPIVYTIYMKHEDSFLPHLDQIPTLLLQFKIILRETLLLAHSIYGPLFNCITHLSSSFFIVITLKSLLHYTSG